MEKIHFAPGKFYATVTARVQDYFHKTNTTSKGNRSLYAKAIILFAAWLCVYIPMLLWAESTLVILLCYAAMGFLATLIGFNVMHDGVHASGSKNPYVNKLL